LTRENMDLKTRDVRGESETTLTVRGSSMFIHVSWCFIDVGCFAINGWYIIATQLYFDCSIEQLPCGVWGEETTWVKCSKRWWWIPPSVRYKPYICPTEGI
jgi:hypothetical protein